MRDISSILLTILGVALFIFFLPTLLWLLLILVVVIVVYVMYQKHKYNKYRNDFMEDSSQETYYTSQNTNTSDDDVIDVEFSESEEDKS